VHTIIIGGLGNFGARISRALAADSYIEVTAASRNPDRGPRDVVDDSRIRKSRLDLTAPDFPDKLAQLRPKLVIHCAGPFQGQGYGVAAAARFAGAHYIDLADGRVFVARFAQANDAATRVAGLLAVTGASTLPALSSAVIDSLIGRFVSLREIQIIIAPAQRAERGAATIAGVFSYAGEPFQWLEDGQWRCAHGWQDLRRVRIDKLGARFAAACDVPDLELLPQRYPGVQTVQFRAALEVRVQHAALWLAAAMRRCGLRLPLERWAPTLDRAAGMLNAFGSERGGMVVSLRGEDFNGRSSQVDWYLLADNNHGPEIPCMAAILLARRIAQDRIDARGAMPCMGLLDLADFEPEFEVWGIKTTIEEVAA
jgi:saccharopine dehydrogenase-like NADP-dependent oxidoreductase